MADEILEQIAKDPNFAESISSEYNDFKSLSVVNKAAASNKLFIKYKQFENAMNIAGETIYDQAIKINTLEDEFKNYGEYNEEEIKQKVKYKKINNSNEEKNKIIRECL